MKVQEFMTPNPVCCTADTAIRDAARLMAENRVGALPVVTSLDHRFLIGIITDRDITCRAVARGKDPAHTTVRECMSSPVATVTPETALETCCKIMEMDQIRRIPVVGMNRQVVGIVAQADVARAAPDNLLAELVKDVSIPTEAPSQIHMAA